MTRRPHSEVNAFMQPQHRALALSALVITATALAHADWPTLLTRLNPAVLDSTPLILTGLTLLQSRGHTTITQHALAATPILLARSSMAQSDSGMPEFTGFTPSQKQLSAAGTATGDSDHPDGLPGLTDSDAAAFVAALQERDGIQQTPDSTAVPQVAKIPSTAAFGDVASTQSDPSSDPPSLAASSSPASRVAQAEVVTKVTEPTRATTSSLAEPLTDHVIAPELLRGGASSDAAAQAEGVSHGTASSTTSARGRQRAGARSAADPAASSGVCGGNPAPVTLAPAATRWDYYFPAAKRSRSKLVDANINMESDGPASYPIAPPLNSSRAAKTALCSTQRPFLQAFPPNIVTASTCRVYLTNGVCTGFFVGENYVATAGHCVSDRGSGAYSVKYDYSGTFGTVCCRTQATETCQPEFSFAIIGMVTTCGWLELGQQSNDGAVLLVRRLVPVVTPGFSFFGIPLNFSQLFTPTPGGCPDALQSAPYSYSGYPGSFASQFQGCFQSFEERLFFTQNPPLVACNTELFSASLTYNGSACPGMSGGPLSIVRSGYRTVFGIAVVAAYQCQTGDNPFFVGASAITNGTETWGVCASCLVDALSASLPPSPPSPPFPPPVGPFTPPPPPPPPRPSLCGTSYAPSPSFSLGDLLGKKHKALLDELLP